jgi:hypothetical protein
MIRYRVQKVVMDKIRCFDCMLGIKASPAGGTNHSDNTSAVQLLYNPHQLVSGLLMRQLEAVQVRFHYIQKPMELLT